MKCESLLLTKYVFRGKEVIFHMDTYLCPCFIGSQVDIARRYESTMYNDIMITIGRWADEQY